MDGLVGLCVVEETFEMAESMDELRGIVWPEGVGSLFTEDDGDMGDSGGD